jgi:hypothetical protein
MRLFYRLTLDEQGKANSSARIVEHQRFRHSFGAREFHSTAGGQNLPQMRHDD